MSDRDRNYNFSAGISVKTLTPSPCLSLSLWPVCCAVRDDCHDVLTGWSELQSLWFHNYAADLSSHPTANRYRPRISMQLHTHTCSLSSCFSPPCGLRSLYQLYSFLICLLLFLSHYCFTQSLSHLSHSHFFIIVSETRGCAFSSFKVK